MSLMHDASIKGSNRISSDYKQIIHCTLSNNSLHLARKYARIFVRRHYLFREAKFWGRDNVRGQISELIIQLHFPEYKLRLRRVQISRGICTPEDRLDQFWLGNIQSCDVFGPIARRRKYLIDYNNYHHHHKDWYVLNAQCSITGANWICSD